MCGMNALRARCGFFWQSSKVLTRLAATPRTLKAALRRGR
jgi:hypothetical protein